MDSKTNKMLQLAGKYVLLGKMSLALEEYLKIHELEPDDTTIMNTIADLYNRMEAREEALEWYTRLAECFEYREMPANAIAAYRRILKLAPKNLEAMSRLASLYERQGQIPNARLQYKIMANQWINACEIDKALDLLKRICDLQPECAESQLELGQALERMGRKTEACQAYLKAAETWVQEANSHAATSAADNIFRLRPKDREFVHSFFNLLCALNMAERGIEYLHSVALDQDPEFKAKLGEVFLQEGNLEVARRLLLSDVRRDPRTYPATMRMLCQLIEQKDLAASLEVVEAVFETAIQQHDDSNLRSSLEAMLKLDPVNVRALTILTNLLIRTNDRKQLEDILQRLVVLHLQSGDVREARDSLNKLVVYGNEGYYLDLLNELNDAMLNSSSAKIREVCLRMVRVLEGDSLETEEPSVKTGLALGVSDLDLGLSLGIELDQILRADATKTA
jgi:tetratricopeptide (TPR) repeat protein